MSTINPELLKELHDFQDGEENSAAGSGIPGVTEPSPWRDTTSRLPQPARPATVPRRKPSPAPSTPAVPRTVPVAAAPATAAKADPRPQPPPPAQPQAGPGSYESPIVQPVEPAEPDDQSPTPMSLMMGSLGALVNWYPWVGWVHVMIYIAVKSKGFNAIAPMSAIFGVCSWFLLFATLNSLPPITSRMRWACLLSVPTVATLFAPFQVRAIAYPLLTLVIYLLAADGLYIPSWQRQAVRFIVSTATTWPLLFLALWLF